MYVCNGLRPSYCLKTLRPVALSCLCCTFWHIDMDKSGAPSQSESSLGPVDDSKSVRSSAVDVEDVVEKLQEDPRRCWEWEDISERPWTFRVPRCSKMIWPDTWPRLDSLLGFICIYNCKVLRLQTAKFTITLPRAMRSAKNYQPNLSEPKLRHAAMRALQSRQSSGS